MIDARSALTVKLMSANPLAYQALVFDGGTPPATRELLQNVQPDQLLSAPPGLPAAAHAMLAGLWLWHDGLDECHRIAQRSPQELEHAAPLTVGQDLPLYGDLKRSSTSQADMTSTLAFWHAIVHRREGDFSNSKYWYARVDGHPLLATLAVRAADVINPFPADNSIFRLVAHGWNPAAFVDLVQQVHHAPGDPRHKLAIALQQIEWQSLFEYCTRAAVGT